MRATIGVRLMMILRRLSYRLRIVLGHLKLREIAY